MLKRFKTELKTFNSDTNEHETWDGPTILATDEIEALILLDFLKMYHVHLVEAKRAYANNSN